MSPRRHISLPPQLAVLTVAEMYAADTAAAASGIASLELMEAAGSAIARVVQARMAPRPITVLCGPGNNGGDGYVAARLLRERGWPVQVARREGQLKGDAAVNEERWRVAGGTAVALDSSCLDESALVIDALFGAGLSRALDDDLRRLIGEIARRAIPCIAVDVPSGVAGDTGAILGGGDDGAPRCIATVTFFRPKPAHLLFPGRALCGDVTVADIGIPAAVLDSIRPTIVANGPALWSLPHPGWADHKYSRGHAIVIGGEAVTGAARLAARGARRIGAGLLTLAVPQAVVPIYASSEPGAFVQPRPETDLAAVLADRRRNGVLLGPGLGVGEATAAMVLQVLATDKAVVLDADALTSFAGAPARLFDAIANRAADTVMTPHAGEFSRLFGDADGSDKLTRCRRAAAQSAATVIFKGADTVIASPGAQVVIDSSAPPWLATGGSGDVLAGMVLGLLVQGCEAWTAAAAAVWLHGAAAARFGRGLIAEDIPEALPGVLTALNGGNSRSGLDPRSTS